MSARDALWRDRHRVRWLRPDASRWIKPDATAFLRPGVAVASVFPTMEAKYNSNQPRVPAGSSEGGQWTIGGEGGDIAFDPPGFDLSTLLDFDKVIEGLSDLSSDLSSIFDFLAGEDSGDSGDFTFVAGDEPDVSVSDNAAPPVQLISDANGSGNEDKPPNIPEDKPERRKDRMQVVKDAANWLARNAGRMTIAADIFQGAVNQAEWLKGYTDAIRTYRDEPKNLEDLQRRVELPSDAGYQNHHIVEKSSARASNISRDLIDSPDNLARIPTLKHYEITSLYMRKSIPGPDGAEISLRQYLQDKDFETRRLFGLETMRKVGVLK